MKGLSKIFIASKHVNFKKRNGTNIFFSTYCDRLSTTIFIYNEKKREKKPFKPVLGREHFERTYRQHDRRRSSSEYEKFHA